MKDRWSVEEVGKVSFLLKNGTRVSMMTTARAVGIAAALNTDEGAAAFKEARDHYNLSQKHMVHYRGCNCLGDSSECCVDDCECKK